jgi:hypothetical protein
VEPIADPIHDPVRSNGSGPLSADRIRSHAPDPPRDPRWSEQAHAPRPHPGSGVRSATRSGARSRPDRGGSQVAVRVEDLARARAAIADGHLPAHPSAAAIRALLSIGPAYARATRDALTTAGQPLTQNTRNQPSPYEPAAEEITEPPFPEPVSVTAPEAKTSTQAVTEGKQLENDEELHTYASLIE